MPKMTLHKGSSKGEIDNWVSDCIRHRRREGKDKSPEQSQAICISQAREASGKRLGK